MAYGAPKLDQGDAYSPKRREMGGTQHALDRKDIEAEQTPVQSAACLGNIATSRPLNVISIDIH